MNAILLMLFMSLGGNEVAAKTIAERELLNSLETEAMLFSSIDEITTEHIHIIDFENNDVKKFGFKELVENELDIEQTLAFEQADFMFEYQGDLFYLKG